MHHDPGDKKTIARLVRKHGFVGRGFFIRQATAGRKPAAQKPGSQSNFAIVHNPYPNVGSFPITKSEFLAWTMHYDYRV